MSEWAAFCGEGSREALGRVVRGIDAAGSLVTVSGADELRRIVSDALPGEFGAVVGPAGTGVSDINLAAALANDGNARCVVLACDKVTGSLRSRAARAGVDLVVDLSELAGEPEREAGTSRGDGGRPGHLPPVPPSAVPRVEGRSDAAGGAGLPGTPGAGAPAGAAGGGEGPSAGMAACAGVIEAAAVAPGEGADGSRAPVIALCSGRGGVGKTAVAVAASVLAAHWGMRVCLVDLDLSCGNAAACLGASRASDLAGAAGTGGVTARQLSRLAVPTASGVDVIGPCARPEAAELAMPLVGPLLGCAARAYDLVVVDTSTTFTDAVAQAAQVADRLVIVSDGRPGTVSSLARMSGLAVRLGVARTRIARLENRADPRGRVDHALARSEVGLEAARAFRVVEGGQELSDLLAAGQAGELAEPGYPFSESVATMLAQLLAELGRLPESEEARRASEGSSQRGWRTIFGLRREAR